MDVVIDRLRDIALHGVRVHDEALVILGVRIEQAREAVPVLLEHRGISRNSVLRLLISHDVAQGRSEEGGHGYNGWR
jgi:hypothetical protein